ncbi:DUF1285 domain-containing protein [Chthonobacter albigriseus]|uniref:DUF1285 domain-containing protein n=1 Tax=Chthonobacter albigriseus TaxID=1683161 RepID=UPI0015EECC12|nr:DUF1285 domain-containing protein [Chthonobacter albigriseus]
MGAAENQPFGGDMAGLAALIGRAAPDGRKPPVERWNPPFCGDIDMAIDRAGQWHYMGTPIGREALVRLFASVLKRDADAYFLVTPVEKVGIRVADVPFLAVEMHAAGDGDGRTLTLRTNVGDVVEAGPEHRLRFVIEEGSGGLVPYVHVRAGLEARFTRALAQEAAELVEEGPDGRLGIRAGGVFHPLPKGAMGEA